MTHQEYPKLLFKHGAEITVVDEQDEAAKRADGFLSPDEVPAEVPAELPEPEPEPPTFGAAGVPHTERKARKKK